MKPLQTSVAMQAKQEEIDMIKQGKCSCTICRFCTYEDEYKEFACHNENSTRYGEILPYDVRQKECKDYVRHNYDSLSLKDALKTETLPDSVNILYERKLPQKDNNFAYLMLCFKTNAELEEWVDAHTRLFMEYMNIATADGDFEEGDAQ